MMTASFKKCMQKKPLVAASALFAEVICQLSNTKFVPNTESFDYQLYNSNWLANAVNKFIRSFVWSSRFFPHSFDKHSAWCLSLILEIKQFDGIWFEQIAQDSQPVFVYLITKIIDKGVLKSNRTRI